MTSTGIKIVLVVAAALMDADNRILIARRPEGASLVGLWEFPGGKINAGETPEMALVRELEEELGIEADPASFTAAGFASHQYPDFHLLMPLFICRSWQGEIEAKEHSALEWVSVHDLDNYPMPPADVPLVAQLRKIIY